MTSQVMDRRPAQTQAQPHDHVNEHHKRRPRRPTANNGAAFTAGGIRSFLRTEGDGEPVVCIHGMLGSSFGYRKLLRELAAHGLRGIAWDLPGFGLADRPAAHDYSWTSLGRFCADAADTLNLDRFHLVVHDIGGPVGFELAGARPGQVASLTVLNTVVDVAGWTPPWTMRPFRWPVIGRLWAAGMTPLEPSRFLMHGCRESEISVR